MFPYSQTIQASGGVAPLNWSVSSGTLPQGISLSGSGTSTTLAGTPATAQAAVTFTIQVADAKSQTATQSYKISINSARSAALQEVQGAQLPAGTAEILGLSAGAFNPVAWQHNTLNWVPDVRMPTFAAQQSGAYRNIYAPWPLEQPGGWRLFYGGWDGQDVPFDQIYSTTTADFLTFGTRDHIISNGSFLNVNNVNVQQLVDGSLHMICTGGQAGNIDNFPVYFESSDGTTWNGVPEPYPAQLSDIIQIQGYAGFSTGNFNGANVLLRDNETWTLYFKDWNHLDTTYRATTNTLPIFHFQGAVLKDNGFVNDVKKITVNGQSWYLMGLVGIDPKQSIFYGLSNDGANFPPVQTLFSNISQQDFYIVAVGFVTKSNQVLGALYGASAVPTLDQNEIFARWLQKKLLLTDSAGKSYSPQGGYGPDRQWFQLPSGSLHGTVAVYAEDGITPLASGSVDLAAGKSYQLVIN
jgi:putative Ig domain-containing protein